MVIFYILNSKVTKITTKLNTDKNMNILSIIENTGQAYQKKASTSGGEYKGPCPWCGGEDRFSIIPKQDHYVCRHCKRSGDSIQFYRDFHGMSYQEARAAMGHPPQNFKKQFLLDKTTWTPREIKTPNEIWQKKGEAIAFAAFKFLMSSAGQPHREYLHNRGLNIDTIKRARIGFVDTAMTFTPESWGLPSTGKNIWIPKGFLIPFFCDLKSLVRLRVRQHQPIAKDRYILISGSSTEYFTYPANHNYIPFDPVYITESELDGWLCWQEFGDCVSIKAIGNSSTRPDENTHKDLKTSSAILLGLDNDPAGQKESGWWKKQYHHAQNCTVPKGKDPGEAFEQGVNLKAWFLDKIKTQDSEKTEIETPPAPVDVDTGDIHKNEIIKIVQNNQNKFCLHDQYCSFLKNQRCLITKQPLSNLTRCPKDKWWLYQTEHPNISQIILGPGVKKIK